jgi:4,5-dihydroxyphthalate decarboxylase
MPTLSLACTMSDRTRPILEGRVTIPGFTLEQVPCEPEDMFRRALNEKCFEVTELSMGSHITTTARGDAAYTAVPVFLSRAFRHSAVYIRTDRGIRNAADLAGRTIGIPEYQQTAALWVRGFLREQYGVDTRGIAWRTEAERIAITLPPGHNVQPLGRDLNAALAAGEIDAFIGPRPPACFTNGSAPVGRLWPDYQAEEIAWHQRTGFFPIMHCVAIRKDVAARYPEAPRALFRAFASARDLALQDLQQVNFLRAALPWITSAFEQQRKLMAGGELWPYGFRRCYDEVAAMIRFAIADGLVTNPIKPEELFDPSIYEETA